MKQPLDENKSFVMKNRLCFKCLAKGHQLKDCRRKVSCEVCGKKHASALHDPQWSQSNSGILKSNLTKNIQFSRLAVFYLKE